MRKKYLWLPIMMLATVLFMTAGEIVDEIVAIVNNEIITLSQYKEQYDFMVQQLKASLKDEEYEKQYALIKKDLLNMIINDILLLQEAKAKNLNVSEQLKITVENIKKENNIESDDDLKRGIQQQGMDYQGWLKQLEENLLRQAVIYSEIDRNIALDDSEIVGYYKLHPQEFTDPEEYRIRAVALTYEGKTAGDLEQKRKEITERLSRGESLNALAKEYGEGPAKESEGDLGFFKKGELDKALEQAVSKLKPGETGGWVEAKSGWYLLKLEEKKESRLKTFDEVRKNVEEKLYTQKKQKLAEEYMKKLKERSFIKILKPNPL